MLSCSSFGLPIHAQCFCFSSLCCPYHGVSLYHIQCSWVPKRLELVLIHVMCKVAMMHAQMAVTATCSAVCSVAVVAPTGCIYCHTSCIEFCTKNRAASWRRCNIILTNIANYSTCVLLCVCAKKIGDGEACIGNRKLEQEPPKVHTHKKRQPTNAGGPKSKPRRRARYMLSLIHISEPTRPY